MLLCHFPCSFPCSLPALLPCRLSVLLCHFPCSFPCRPPALLPCRLSVLLCHFPCSFPCRLPALLPCHLSVLLCCFPCHSGPHSPELADSGIGGQPKQGYVRSLGHHVPSGLSGCVRPLSNSTPLSSALHGLFLPGTAAPRPRLLLFWYTCVTAAFLVHLCDCCCCCLMPPPQGRSEGITLQKAAIGVAASSARVNPPACDAVVVVVECFHAAESGVCVSVPAKDVASCGCASVGGCGWVHVCACMCALSCALHACHDPRIMHLLQVTCAQGHLLHGPRLHATPGPATCLCPLPYSSRPPPFLSAVLTSFTCGTCQQG